MQGVSYEIVVECPGETKMIEEALMTTQLIDWSRHIAIPFAPKHIFHCIKRIMAEKRFIFEYNVTTEIWTLDTNIQFEVK